MKRAKKRRSANVRPLHNAGDADMEMAQENEHDNKKE
jgi:hypothetical protein